MHAAQVVPEYWQADPVRPDLQILALRDGRFGPTIARWFADYAAQPKWWEPIVVKTGISDFKQQPKLDPWETAADTIAMSPPLVIERNQIDEIIDLAGKAIKATA